MPLTFFFFFSSRRRHTRSDRDWSSDVCSSDLKKRFLLLFWLRIVRRAGIGRVCGFTHAGDKGLATLRDRKSTRLNSSHDQISYAVFCLKKKKKYIINLNKKYRFSIKKKQLTYK